MGFLDISPNNSPVELGTSQATSFSSPYSVYDPIIFPGSSTGSNATTSDDPATATTTPSTAVSQANGANGTSNAVDGATDGTAAADTSGTSSSFFSLSNPYLWISIAGVVLAYMTYKKIKAKA